MRGFSALRHFRRAVSGQALVEFALIFPLQLLLTFGILQLIFLMVASLVTNYAAYKVARAAAVYGCGGNNDEVCLTTARIIFSPLCFRNTSGAPRLEIPGWGGLRGSDAARDRVEIVVDRDEEKGQVTVTLTYYQELVFPFIDAFFGYFTPGGKRIIARHALNAANSASADPSAISGNCWCFPIRARATVALPPVPVHPGSEVYEYHF